MVHRHRQGEHGPRTQLPLQLAWSVILVSQPPPNEKLNVERCRALTIHKSQGQSLDAVGVRLNATFEKGQWVVRITALVPAVTDPSSSHRAYVALSRCRKPGGMKIEGFHPGVVMGEPA